MKTRIASVVLTAVVALGAASTAAAKAPSHRAKQHVARSAATIKVAKAPSRQTLVRKAKAPGRAARHNHRFV